MKTALLPLSLLLGAGCLGGEGTLSVESRLDEASRAFANVQTASLELEGDHRSIVIDRVRIAVSELELEGRQDRDDQEFEVADVVVEVALDGQDTVIVAREVPANRYHEIGLELMLASGDEGAAFADFADGAASSIRVEGSVDGTPFVFGSRVAVELERDLDQAAVVRHGGTAQVSVPFDVAEWFTDVDGSILNPADPDAAAAIDARILASLDDLGDIETEDDGDDDGDGEDDD